MLSSNTSVPEGAVALKHGGFGAYMDVPPVADPPPGVGPLAPPLARIGASIDIRRLTPREREIISWVALGKPDWQIGRILMISPKTVNYHVETAKRKLGAATRGQAVAIAAGLGLLDVQAVLPPSPPVAR